MRDLATIIKRLKQEKPDNVREALRDCKLTLRFLANGAFRDVYKIVGTKYIIKFPREDWGGYDVPEDFIQMHKKHSRQEIRAWKKLKKECDPEIAPMLTDILYSNERSGIIIMPYYRRASWFKHSEKIYKIRKRFPGHDLFVDNFGIDEHGNFKIIDMAFMGKAIRDRDAEES